ncbi:hypothetical protein BDR07DRAFT_1562960 [Suillus spraguei]|nr:hypothetical protein BDR07DRAFT_1562960 [Suillus spraguei]
MHTQPEDGLDIALANELQRSFAWVPSLTSDSCSSDNEFLAGPESMTDEELLEEFSRFENEALESHRGLQEGADEVPDIFEGGIIDWNELEKVDKRITVWNIDALLSSEGVVSMQ